MENISHKIPGSFPKDSDYVSAPSTPRGTRCARVGPPKSGSSESSCDEGTFWGSGKRADSNTSSTRTTPSPPPKRSTKPREESPSPTARRSAPSAGSPGAHSALTDRANLSEATVPAPARGPVERPQHEPYIGQETFAEALEKPPGPLDLEPRQIYVYSIQEYPGLLKVGYTTRGVSAHLDEWRTRCKGNPILRFVYPENAPLLPCVHRVKTLIHIELQECRKQLPPCPACQERHDGWFDIELPELKSTIEFWGRLYQMQTDTLALVLEWRTSYPESYSGVRKRRKAAPTTGKGSRDDSILDHFQPVGKPKPRQSRSPGGEEDTVLAAANNPELAPVGNPEPQQNRSSGREDTLAAAANKSPGFPNPALTQLGKPKPPQTRSPDEEDTVIATKEPSLPDPAPTLIPKPTPPQPESPDGEAKPRVAPTKQPTLPSPSLPPLPIPKPLQNTPPIVEDTVPAAPNKYFILMCVLQDRIWRVLKKTLPIYVLASFIMSFYPHQDCLAAKVALIFLYFCAFYN